jgi:hypothetical protein
MTNLKNAIAIYLLIVFSILYSKPKFIFNEEGNLKEFGTGKNKTVFSLWFIFLIGAIVSYIIVTVLS